MEGNRQERRRYPRANLRIPVSSASGLDAAATEPELVTVNISAGGMYLKLSGMQNPPRGAPLHFELDLPPALGYVPQGCKVKGTGRVVRTCRHEDGTTGLAVEFTQPLALEL